MPTTAEDGGTKVKRRNRRDHDVAEREKFDYPMDNHVDHEAKEINLVWFAKHFYEIQSSDGTKHLDHNLAMYCIAKHLPSLPIAKWNLLFVEEKDPDTTRVFDAMRKTYTVIHTDYPKDEKVDKKRKGWSNHVLLYFHKLFRNAKSQGVMYLFLYQLLSMHELTIDKLKAFAIIGGKKHTTVPYKINDVFSQQPVAQYKLLLPNNLMHLYTGKGLEAEDLAWVTSPLALMDNSAANAALEETDDQKSSVFWRREIQKKEGENANIEESLALRRKAVEEAERELSKNVRELSKLREMLSMAVDKEALLPQDGTPAQKRERIMKVKSVVDLLDDTAMTDEEASEIFLELRGQNKQSQRAGPSSQRGLNSQLQKGLKRSFNVAFPREESFGEGPSPFNLEPLIVDITVEALKSVKESAGNSPSGEPRASKKSCAANGAAENKNVENSSVKDPPVFNEDTVHQDGPEKNPNAKPGDDEDRENDDQDGADGDERGEDDDKHGEDDDEDKEDDDDDGSLKSI